MPTSHLFEVALAVDGSKLSSKKVSKLSRRYIRLKKKISTMADDPATDAWMCPACSFAENSLDCLRCTMCTAARPRGSHSVLLFSTKMKDTNHLFEVALAVDGSKLSSKKVSKLSRRYIRLKKKISTMADDPATDAWMCPACSFAKNSLDCLRCTMCTAA